MIVPLLFVLGGLWRLYDGSSAAKGTGIWMKPLFVLLCVWALWPLSSDISLNGMATPNILNILTLLWIVSVSAINIFTGRTKWESFTYMPFRYSVPAAVAVAPALLFELVTISHGLLYAGLMAFAGLMYPVLFWVDKKLVKGRGKGLPKWRIIDGPEAYSRMNLGGCLIAGLSLLV